MNFRNGKKKLRSSGYDTRICVLMVIWWDRRHSAGCHHSCRPYTESPCLCVWLSDKTWRAAAAERRKPESHSKLWWLKLFTYFTPFHMVGWMFGCSLLPFPPFRGLLHSFLIHPRLQPSHNINNNYSLPFYFLCLCVIENKNNPQIFTYSSLTEIPQLLMSDATCGGGGVEEQRWHAPRGKCFPRPRIK